MIVMVLGGALLGGGLWLLWAVGGLGSTTPTTGAVPSDEEACRQGDAAACDRLGLCKLKGGCRLAKDGKAAGELFRRACERGRAAGCYHLGHCYAPYPYCGFAKDLVKAAALYEQACEGGYLHGCVYYALTYAASLGSPGHIDDAIFMAYVERACRGGDQLGCAHMHERGLRLTSSPGHQAAVAVEQKACAAGVDHACLLLARCHDTLDGESCGLPKDDQRAAAYYEKACRG
ncbi:MAG: tetratricopeptide repeat protein, partial [Anaerolineae bacterium]